MKNIKIILGILTGTSIILYGSYFFSKTTVDEFLGDSIKYLDRYESGVALLPFGEKAVWWRFTFNVKGASDEFIIYTSLFGSITRMSPHRIEKRDVIKFVEEMDGALKESSLKDNKNK